jgi:putative restriction endonuclease
MGVPRNAAGLLLAVNDLDAASAAAGKLGRGGQPGRPGADDEDIDLPLPGVIGTSRGPSVGSLGSSVVHACALLGQEELDISVLEAGLRDQIAQHHGASVWSELETERILLAAVRVGQHVFARQVLANCGSRCVFCGLHPSSFGATRMLLAGHIKPWKDSTPAERLDPRNGLAACPAHDVAFDTGMLTVNGGLKIHLARPLADAIQTDAMARQYYGSPPLREVILLPDGAQAPARKYLDWHRQKVFIP